MKTIPVSVILAGVLSSHSSLAENPSRKERPANDFPKRNFMEAWKNADQNGDGALSFAEFSSLPRLQAIPEDKRTQLFQRLDKDGNNSITPDEMRQLKPSRPDDQSHRKRLWELDADKSGGISREEFSADEMYRKLPPEKQQKLFDRLDTNKDGTISPEDRPERPGPNSDHDRPRLRQPGDSPSPNRPMMFPRLDTNRDGFLDFSEFSKMPGISQLGEDEQEKAFETIDADKDLKLSPEEMAKSRPLGREHGKTPRPVKPLNQPKTQIE